MARVLIYSKVTTQSGTIYSTTKGNFIQRGGDTIIIFHDAYSRVVHLPWSSVNEADYQGMGTTDDVSSVKAKEDEKE